MPVCVEVAKPVLSKVLSTFDLWNKIKIYKDYRFLQRYAVFNTHKVQLFFSTSQIAQVK